MASLGLSPILRVPAAAISSCAVTSGVFLVLLPVAEIGALVPAMLLSAAVAVAMGGRRAWEAHALCLALIVAVVTAGFTIASFSVPPDVECSIPPLILLPLVLLLALPYALVSSLFVALFARVRRTLRARGFGELKRRLRAERARCRVGPYR